MPSPHKSRFAAAGLAAALWLAGCAAPAPPPAAAPADVALRVLAFRGGSAARLGHNHVLLPGDLRITGQGVGTELRFRLDALVLDPPPLRASLGPGFEAPLGADAVAATRANLLKSLDAERHPEVVVRCLQVVGEGPARAVEVEVALHGQSRRQWLAVRVDGQVARGDAVLRQSDFGIAPFSVMNGLLAVRDELVVSIALPLP